MGILYPFCKGLDIPQCVGFAYIHVSGAVQSLIAVVMQKFPRFFHSKKYNYCFWETAAKEETMKENERPQTTDRKLLRLSLTLNVLLLLAAVVFVYHKRDKIMEKFKSTTATPTVVELSKFNNTPLRVENDSVMFPGATRTLTMLFLGNSITRHAPIDEMPCRIERGMAATTPDKDYVHQLVHIIAKNHKLNVLYSVANIAEFERTFFMCPFSMRKLDSAVAKRPDILVVQIGENVLDDNLKDPEKFEREYIRLLGNFPDSKRILTLPFWPNKQKQYAITEVAIKSNSSLADISHLGAGTDPMNFASSQQKFNMPGVGGHPGNVGMRRIADCLYAEINAFLRMRAAGASPKTSGS